MVKSSVYKKILLFVMIFTLSFVTGVPSYLANSDNSNNYDCSYLIDKAYAGQEGSRKVLATIILNINPRVSPKSAYIFAEGILDSAEYYQVDPLLILAIIKEESAFKPDAISNAGAIGLMQLMPKTAEYISNRELDSWKGVYLLVYPQYNITLGTAYFKDLLDNYDNQAHLALTAYNMGPTLLNNRLNRGNFTGSSEYSEKVLFTYNQLVTSWGFFNDLLKCLFDIKI